MILLAIAGAVVTACSLAAMNRVINPVEVAISEQFRKIPAASMPMWTVPAWTGSWVGIASATAYGSGCSVPPPAPWPGG